MKRSLSLLLAVIMLIGILPFQVFADVESAELETKIEEIEEGAEEKSPLVKEDVEEDELQIGDEIKGAPLGAEPNVTLVGQWINDSAEKKDTPKHYELTDKIGDPEYNSGLLRSLAKQFLGWSDKAPVANGVLAEGAKLFSPEDTIADVFGSSIPADAKIYAVYYEINNPYGDPFPQDAFSLTALSGVLQNLKGRINNNKVMIDENTSPEDILKNTENHSSGDVIVDYYQKKDDVNDINEVVLNSEFEMDWVVAMLAYRNKAGSNAIRPILSYDYNTRYKENNFPTTDGKAAGYTHVDLNMNFGTDKGLVIPDNLFLEFKSYTWRPLYAFGIKDDGTKEVLNILGKDRSSKGNGIDAFKTLVSGEKPETKFGVETKGYRKITLRVVLREWDNSDNNGFNGERIPESKIKKGPQGTIASEILSNMTLKVLGSADGIKNENIVRITDEKAKALADGDAKNDIDITGSINGHVFASAGSVSAFGFTVPLASDLEIKESKAIKDLKLSFIHKKEEPKPVEKVVLTLDENHFDGKILTHELDKCEEVGKYLYNPTREGYIFRGWNTKADGSGDFVKASDLICESKTIYAIWEKEAVEHHHEYVPTLPVYADASKKDKVRPSESHSAYIFGYEDKSVRANNNLTRAEAAAMVTRLAKLDLSNKAKADYKDLQDKAWYLPYINAALKAGMIDADGENLRPNDKITRAEFAKMLAAIDKENDYVSKFQDVKGHKYEKEINKIDGNKRIAGYEDGTFRPDNNLTRAEAASFLNRMFNRVADDAAIRNIEDSLVKFTDLNKGDWFYYEIVEAANSHELVRRDGSDKYDRVYESWLRLIDNGITR